MCNLKKNSIEDLDPDTNFAHFLSLRHDLEESTIQGYLDKNDFETIHRLEKEWYSLPPNQSHPQKRLKLS
jgi:hypothetical protein